MKPNGLTFDEALELITAPSPLMTLAAASSHLLSRGYDCRPEMLELLIQNGVVKPAGENAWSRADVDAAAEHFEDCDLLTPYAEMCKTLGCRYADFLRSLREAAKRESAKYGRRVPDDDLYFVMHCEPPRDDRPARISFTFCDDIRQRVERGEAV
ncbi:MAG: hypothetical protein BWZ02_02931 [Lentisphaerae bacterium ADurb.BinA184]|jgi:hypothetical protein|nr:MAG: hypothetical protein BWZ02_02931 [Lentisphaerae bacterium ADurb.BinA184]HOI56534.1 hypothetical protein [Phycisphaerae bacterium]